MRRILFLLATMLAAVLLASGVALAKPFSNATTITINDATLEDPNDPNSASIPGAATPYPSAIEVSGLRGTIADVNLKLRAYSHTFPDDVGVLLVGPTGAKALVMSDVGGGGGYDLSRQTIVLDDEARDFLPDSTEITTGTYRPTQGDGAGLPVPADFPSPAPSGPYGTDLSVFDGTNPNGTWSLYVIDDAFGDSGQIARGWVLTIKTAR